MLSRRDSLRLAGVVAAASLGAVSIGKAEAAAAPTVKTPVNFAFGSETHVRAGVRARHGVLGTRYE